MIDSEEREDEHVEPYLYIGDLSFDVGADRMRMSQSILVIDYIRNMSGALAFKRHRGLS